MTISQVYITSKDDAGLPVMAHSLGNDLQSSYERLGDIADLQEAIHLDKQAIVAVPENHPDMPWFLDALGSKHLPLYEQTRQISDLNEGIKAAKQAIALSPDDHPDRARRLGNPGAKLREYSKYLAWLWTACVRDVINELSINRQALDLPRVWWIGTGLTSSMPFHAAGLHSSRSDENAYSRILSSYAPSIKTLAYARGQAQRTEGTSGSLLVTTMPTTPAAEPGGRSPPKLPGVPEEEQKVQAAADGHFRVETLDNPSVAQVLERLQDCTIAHFACHGTTDHKDPSNSGLILQRRAEGQGAEGVSLTQDRLTVQKVSDLQLSRARLAYLSACSTAENKAARLTDEVIHVVSGFQVAGFPHVVGCLWPAVDRVCVEVTSRFYAALFRDRGLNWRDEDAAMALREAVMAARAEEINMPLNWAQFIHYGP